MRLELNTIPKRKSKPKPNVLENHEPYLQLRSLILTNKLRPFQEIGLFFGPDDVAKLGMKAPWRIAVDRLRALVRGAGLGSDYQIVKYQTDTPGVWFVKVRYEPPIAQMGTGASQEQLAPAVKRRGRPRKVSSSVAQGDADHA